MHFEQNEQSIQQQKHFDATHPLATEAANCWSPENAKAFSTVQNNKSEKSFAGNDDAINAFFAQSLVDGITSEPQRETTQPRNASEFDRDAQAFDKSAGSLNDVLKSLNGKNVDGALKDINSAVSGVKDGMSATRGQMAAKGEIKGGIDKIGNGQKEMQGAIDLLNEGKISEASEAIQKALSNVVNGKKEIQYGVNDINSYKPTSKKDDPNSKTETKF